MISIHQLTTKKACGYAKGFSIYPWPDLELIAEQIVSNVWSPCIWRGGNRRKANFIECHMLALDFDDGKPSLAQAVEKYKHYQHIIATTKSHQKAKDDKPACDRFRLIVPFKEPITNISVYEYNMAVITHKTGADKSAKDGGRFFWPCVDIVSMSTDGVTATIKPIPEAKPEQRKDVPWWRHPIKGPMSQRTKTFLETGDLFMDGRNNCAYRVALDLLRHQWSAAQIKERLHAVTTLSEWEINDIVSRSANNSFKVLPFSKKD